MQRSRSINSELLQVEQGWVKPRREELLSSCSKEPTRKSRSRAPATRTCYELNSAKNVLWHCDTASNAGAVLVALGFASFSVVKD